jgi:hypothetical protein
MSATVDNNLQILLRQLAQAVAGDWERNQRAKAEANAREEVLLRTIVEEVGPALPVVSGKIVVGTVLRYGKSNTRSAETRTHAQEGGVDLRGLHVAGDHVPKVDLPDAESGTYRGRGLWLLEDGRFLELTFRGTWSSVGDEDRRWEADVRPLTLAQVAAAWPVAEVLERVLTTLTKQNRSKQTQAYEARTARVNAILALIPHLKG